MQGIYNRSRRWDLKVILANENGLKWIKIFFYPRILISEYFF